MPAPGQTGQVLELLQPARLRVSSARDHLDSLNTGVAEASRALARADTQNAAPGGPASQPGSQDADRCPTGAAPPSRLPWKRPVRSIPPWIETSRLMSAVARVGHTQPWAYPDRNEIRYRDLPSADLPSSGRRASGIQPGPQPVSPAPSDVGYGPAERIPAQHVAGSPPQPDPAADSPSPLRRKDSFSEGAHHRLSAQSRVQPARPTGSAPPVPGR